MFLGAAGAAAGGATAAAVGAGELHKTLTFSSLRYLFHNFFFFKSHHFFLSIDISQQGQWLWRT